MGWKDLGKSPLLKGGGPAAVAGPALSGVQAERQLPRRLEDVSVSIICPTHGREERHPALYEAFCRQDHPNKDLWVLDDSNRYSPTLYRLHRRDERVHYQGVAKRLTIGDKRNQLIAASRGQVIVHFDDDDWYAPDYVTRMLERLIRLDADLVTLAVWKERRESDGEEKLYDARQMEQDLWGFGFSYVYRRWVMTQLSFPLVNSGEDYALVAGMQRCDMKVASVEDGAAWAVHLIHGGNTSRKAF